MTTALLVLQFVAALFAAGVGAFGFLKSKGFEEIEIRSIVIGGPSKRMRRLTKEARAGVILVCAGLLVSLAARIIEQVLAAERSRTAQAVVTAQFQRTEHQ